MPCSDDVTLGVINARRWLREQDIEVKQRLDEVLLSFDWIADRRPLDDIKRVVEIGTLNGGWFALAYEAFRMAAFTLIDPKPRNEIYGVIQGRPARPVYNAVSLVEAKSEDAVKEFEPGIDVLHIDGLHKFPQPTIDWETYRPLMAEDSFVIFHDTKLGGVAQVFRPLAETYESTEIVGCEGPKGIGTGVLHLRGDA